VQPTPAASGRPGLTLTRLPHRTVGRAVMVDRVLEIISVAQVQIAESAHRSFGKGMCAAGPNFGDCSTTRWRWKPANRSFQKRRHCTDRSGACPAHPVPPCDPDGSRRGGRGNQAGAMQVRGRNVCSGEAGKTGGTSSSMKCPNDLGGPVAYRNACPRTRRLFKCAIKAPILSLSATVDYGDKRHSE
jgi:hypothetical protein